MGYITKMWDVFLGEIINIFMAHCTCLRSARHRPNQHANESKTSHCNVAAILRIHHSGRLTIFDGDWNLFFLWVVYAIALLTRPLLSGVPPWYGPRYGGSRQRMKFREWRNDMKLPNWHPKRYIIYIHIYTYINVILYIYIHIYMLTSHDLPKWSPMKVYLLFPH